ncbi:hypothetical protein GBN67_08065 [Acinetobacter johnsonii]|uniref:HNH endonuclease n=1 Tax=Acinetobacter johnsonii TaxID=40214 RepID=UPI001F3B7CBC|nr:HNH endonuclease [Acinetobacter johnsonii]UIZ94896.1 hypothetical protein GBN67_08065 [Acinetobacter johnsonii]
MNKCTLCIKPINENNQTDEHVIPQAIGGRLKVKDFICITCNNKSGHQWDSILSDQLSFFSTSLNIKREKKLPNYLVKTLDGKEYLRQPNGDFILIRPMDNVIKNKDGSFNVKIEAPNLKVAKDLIKKVIKENNLSSSAQDLMLKNIKHSSSPIDQLIVNEISFGGIESGKSLVKTALAMAFTIGIDLKQCDLATGYLLENKEACFGYFYSKNKDFIKNREDIPFHCVHIKACSASRRVYGYIEYFGAFRIVLSMASNYLGEDKVGSYMIDPINSRKIDLDIDLDVNDDDIQRIYNYEMYDPEEYKNAIGTILGLIVEKSRTNNMKNRLNDVLKRWDDAKTYEQNMRESIEFLIPYYRDF